MLTDHEQRCAWCKAGAAEPLEAVSCGDENLLVHAAHRQALERFCREVAAAKSLFLGIIGGAVLLAVVGAAIAASGWKAQGGAVLGIALAICGATLLRYPFATPQTVALVGVRDSIRLVRIAAVIVLVLAFVAAYNVAR